MYGSILIPVVLDDAKGVARSFEAAKLLADSGAKFTVLHVVEAIPAYAAMEVSSAILESVFDDARAELAELAKGLEGGEFFVIRGHAGRSIVDFAEENGVDCIVMRSHKPGLENWFIGSTADRVVRHAKCSVHVIR